MSKEMMLRRLVRDLIIEAKKKKQKKKKKKKEVKCPLLPNGKRDYKCEYQKYGGASKKGKKDRAARNKARKQAEKMGLVKKGDGLEIDHIMPLSLGGSNDQINWQVMTRADNRKKGKKWDGKAGAKTESIRQLVRQILLEEFSEQDVKDQMADDPRDYGRGKFGANAKDIFRQQREADPKIDQFLEEIITIHWKRIEWTQEFSQEIDYDILREPLQSTNQNDEISCSPYMPADDGTPIALESRGWHNGDKLGIEVKGWVSWLEHGDAQTGHGFERRGEEKTSPSGDNKQPRITKLGRDPSKGDSMADVIQTGLDYWRQDTLSSYGDGEALVDNWEVIKVWYIDEGDEMAAMQASMMLSKRFDKRIPYQQAQGEEQFGLEDYSFYEDFDGEWSP